MNRREFSLIVAGATVAGSAPAPLLAQRTASNMSAVSQQTAKLYRRALVLDCNSGPPGEDGRLPLPQTDLDMVRNCGIDVVKWSIGGLNADFAETVKEIAYIHQMIEIHPAYFTQVRVPTDMDRAKREGKMGIIFSFESVEMLEGKLERIESEWISRAAVVFPLPASPVISTGTSVCESNSTCVRSWRVAGLAAMKYNSSLIRSISG